MSFGPGVWHRSILCTTAARWQGHWVTSAGWLAHWRHIPSNTYLASLNNELGCLLPSCSHMIPGERFILQPHLINYLHLMDGENQQTNSEKVRDGSVFLPFAERNTLLMPVLIKYPWSSAFMSWVCSHYHRHLWFIFSDYTFILQAVLALWETHCAQSSFLFFSPHWGWFLVTAAVV